YARAQGEAAGQQGPARVPLEAARDPVGAGQQEEAEQEVALAGAPGSTAEVIEAEEQRARGGGDSVAERLRVDPEGRARRAEPAQVEAPPREIARTAHREHGQVQHIDAGEIHVEGVTVRHTTLAD